MSIFFAAIFSRPDLSSNCIFKKQGRHQAKDHAQLFILRDSFLDLIPALCFHIHGWEDGSLCQYILFYVATLPYRGRSQRGMIGECLCLHRTYFPLHFGQTTAKSAGVFSETYSSGISSDSFFASRLTAKAIFFAVQFGLGQSKEGRRRRSSAMAFFNFVLFPP